MRIKSILIIIGITFLCTEIALRLFMAYKIGPEYFLYGTKWSRSGFEGTTEWTQSIEKKGSVGDQDKVLRYFKYFPYQKRLDRNPITQETYPVRINSKGFRGKDFREEKEKGVLRIAALGGSSTFGFCDMDNETYPYFIENILRAEIRKNPFSSKINDVEVINFGIPHLTSDQILSLFIVEVLPLHPDIVIFYEGVNDAEKGIQIVPGPINLSKESLLRSIMKTARDHLLLALVPWSIIRDKTSYTEEYLERFLPGKSEFFIGNIAKIQELCAARGIKFFIITQQARSLSVNPQGLTFKEEVNLIKQKLQHQKGTKNDIYFLAHDRIMDDLQNWAKEHGTLMIDGIGTLDAHRECLVSWVHLNAEGNRLLAEAIARDILIQLRKADRN